VVKRGKYIFQLAGCNSCHTNKKQKAQRLAGGVPIKTPFGTFYGSNITPDKMHGIGNWSKNDFIKALREGVSPEGSHYFPVFPYTSYTKMTDQDISDLRAYIFSLPPVTTPNRPHNIRFPFNNRRLLYFWKMLFFQNKRYKPVKSRNKNWNRGAYLVQGLIHCSECHTPRNMLGAIETGLFLSGSIHGGTGELIPNITRDRDTGTGKWTDSDLTDFLKFGMLPNGDIVGGSMADVIENLSELSSEDGRNIVEYLKSVPAITNNISIKR